MSSASIYRFLDSQQQHLFSYHIQRSQRRKTISLVIRRGQVKVLAPDYVQSTILHQFVHEKSTWVVNKLSELVDTQPPKISFQTGEKIPFFGSALSLEIIPVNQQRIHFPISLTSAFPDPFSTENPIVDGTLQLRVPLALKDEKMQEYCQLKLDDWLKRRGVSFYQQRAMWWAKKMQLQFSTIKVKTLKSRWGSCNSKGVITFNSALLKAPLTIQDYVIVHELSHLEHMDHSDKFWSVVALYYPPFKQARDWLRSNGTQLLPL